jgi:hypothetical protein
MNTGTVVVVMLFVLVAGAVVVTLLRGRFSGSGDIGGAKLRVRAGRKAPPPAGEARIEGSKAGRDASAAGTRAIVKNTKASRDLKARAEEHPDPKA